MSMQNLELISADYREQRLSAASTCWRQFAPSVSSAVMTASLFTARTHLACNKHYCNKQQTKNRNAPSGTKKKRLLLHMIL